MATTQERFPGPSESASVPEAARQRPRFHNGNQWWRWTLTASALMIAIGLLVAATSRINSLGSAELQGDAITRPVSRGTFRITVTEDGSLQSASNVEVKCQVKGGSTILWIVEDGKYVEKGETIVKLDPSEIEDQLNQQQITYQQARSAKIRAQEDYEAAKIAVEEYLEGTYEQELQNKKASVTLAKEHLRSAKNMLQHTRRMFRKGYVTKKQLETQQFAVQRAELNLQAAQTDQMVLQKFTKRKRLKELKSDRDALEAEFRSAEESLKLEKRKLNQLEEQLAACTISAPTSGMVVYANEDRRGPDIEIKEGAQIRDQQTIVRLPDLSNMEADVSVHESKIDRLKPGQPATIRVQDRILTGTVKSIANQPEETSWFSPDVKEYETIVKIDEETSNLLPGMSAEVEILVAELKDVLSVPVQAVVDERYCWIQTPDGLQRRSVVLGRTNDKFIQIKEGVQEGQSVVLNPQAVIPEAGEIDASDSPFGETDSQKAEATSGEASAAG